MYTGIFMIDKSSYDYFPMKVGSSIEYKCFAINGVYHPDTMCIDAYIQNIPPINVRITSTIVSTPLFAGFYQYWHSPETPDSPPLLKNGLGNGFSYKDKIYVGESMNELGQIMIPPEPLLVYRPVAGEEIVGSSNLYKAYDWGEKIGVGNWRYKTIAHYDTWGAFNDVWRTALSENDYYVYNYVFAKGIGMVDFYQLNIQTGIGREWYAIKFDGLPVV
jgi:hypothetical protein